jgi:broad specificity phosphatase PhoE
MKFVTFARHGATPANQTRMLQGARLDNGLTDLGRIQAHLLAVRLAQYRPTRLLSSPMLRAQQTAIILGHQLLLTPESRNHLRERDFGDYEGLDRISLLQMRKDLALSNDDPTGQFPEGQHRVESSAKVSQRWMQLCSELNSEQDSTDELILVTHAGFIRATLYSCLSIPDDHPTAIRVGEGSFIRAKYFSPSRLAVYEIW